MADWIKLSTGMFDNKKIKQIEAMPNGKRMLLVWVRLICLAGLVNDGGKIYVTANVPYTLDGLAVELCETKAIIKKALELFESYNMISYDDNKYIVLNGWEKHQNIEGLERIRQQHNERMKKYRSKKKATSDANVAEDNITSDVTGDATGDATCDVEVMECSSEVTVQNKNKNKSKNKNKEKEKDEDIDISSSSSSPYVPLPAEVDDNLSLILKLFSDNIHPITGRIEFERLRGIVKSYGVANAKHGIEVAVEQGHRSLSYITAVARNAHLGIEPKRADPSARAKPQQKNDVVGTYNQLVAEMCGEESEDAWRL